MVDLQAIHAKAGLTKSITLAAHTADITHCPVHHLDTYDNRAHDAMAPALERRRLFLTLNGSSNAAAVTLGRWMKDTLAPAGIDTAVFSAHSTRSAASTAAMRSGVPMEGILMCANWSRDSTRKRFYYHPRERRRAPTFLTNHTIGLGQTLA